MVILGCHDENAIAGLWSGGVVVAMVVVATVAMVVVATVAMVWVVLTDRLLSFPQPNRNVSWQLEVVRVVHHVEVAGVEYLKLVGGAYFSLETCLEVRLDPRQHAVAQALRTAPHGRLRTRGAHHDDSLQRSVGSRGRSCGRHGSWRICYLAVVVVGSAVGVR